MTADQQPDGTTARRLAPPDSAPIPVTQPTRGLDNLDQPGAGPDQADQAALGLDTLDQPGAGPDQAPGAIATLVTPPVAVIGVPDDPRTGEPRVPRTVLIAAVLSFVAVANVTVGLLWVYWDAVPKENFANASWLMGRFVTEPGSAARVLLAVAVTVIALLIAVPLAITGYYAWAGYRWSRVSGIIGAALSFGALTLNVYAWSTIPLAVVAAGLLWLPASSRYFLAWHARRHPQQAFAPPTVDVFYGPLPKYRQG